MFHAEQINVEAINNAIWDLWQRFPREAGPIVPKFISNPAETDTLLFLSYNPSFPKETQKWSDDPEWQKLKFQLKERKLLLPEDEKIDYRRAFLWERIEALCGNDREEAIKLFADIHYKARLFYPSWFGPLNDLAETAFGIKKEKYGHVDFYLWADANSKVIEDRVKLLTTKDILKKQKELAIRLLKIHKPRIIVCVYKNAWAAFKEHYAKNLSHRNELRLGDPPGNTVIEYANATFDEEGQVPIIACPNLPDYNRGKMTIDIIRQLIIKLKVCWDRRSVEGMR